MPFTYTELNLVTKQSQSRAATDDVVYLKNCRLTWIHTYFLQDWHKTGAKSIEVFLRIKEHRNFHLVSRAVTDFEFKSWCGLTAFLFEPGKDCVVLRNSH